MLNVPKLRFGEFEGEWVEKKLGDIATFLKGKGISKSDIVKDGKLECIRYGELYTVYGESIKKIKSRTNLDKNNLILSQYNDVIIPASGETQIDIATASCVLKEDVALSGDLNIIRTKENGLFLSYYLNSNKKIDIARLSQGISVVHLYSSQLKLLKLNLPKEDEQQKIANFITSIDQKINQLTQKKILLDSYKKGVMQKIFSQEIRFSPTFVPNLRLGTSLRDDGGEFKDWEIHPIGDFIDLLSGFAFKSENIVELKDGIPLLRGINITEGKIRHSEEIDKFYIGSHTNLDKYFLEENDLVISMDGSKVGKNSALIGKEDVGSLLIQRVARIRTNNNTSLSFIYQHINSVLFHNYVNRVKTSSGIPHISSKQIKDFKINFPCLEEQQKIANFLTSLDQKIIQTTQQIEAMKSFKKGLLQGMFV